MKRDMNLVRLLLLELEGEQPKPDLSSYTPRQQEYHKAKLIEAKLVHGEVIRDATGHVYQAAAIELTWAGHEFLDAARDDKTWKEVTEKVAKAGVAVTLPILFDVLTFYVKKKLKIPQ